ncbi:FAD-binding oxidoreductase [Micromonospora sp. B11E3]|uniref:NAD(P)/FAD-dependent oxidoreductase n=1 Tax=Micromonospora sp. B11E3 TaxID=3153562 RepID=UPI00325E383A
MTTRRAIVVGGGIVGLCTAWFLQQDGFEVTVLERESVGAGSSWANAGWVMPARAVPLTEPGTVREGLHGLFRSSHPFSVSSWSDPSMWWFLTRFAANCTRRRWEAARHAMSGLNGRCLEAFDQLAAHGVTGSVIHSPILVGYRDRGAARHFPVGPDLIELSVEAAQHKAPQLGSAIQSVVELIDTRHVDPAAFLADLSHAVKERGGCIKARNVVEIRPGVRVVTHVDTIKTDVAVIATGSRLSTLTRPLGVRTPVRAGRGYSFTVATDVPAPHPIYLPEQRLACTPVAGGLRIAGIMEFAPESAPAREGRLDAMARAAAGVLRGVDWSTRAHEWVGSRPITSDGIPVVGSTRIDGVYVAGGHGMWGVTQGPATGMLLARQIATGEPASELLALDPLR